VLALAALLSLAIGVTLGMLGGGGAILTLPMLVYALHVEPKTAIATSLFVVGATSLVGMSVHARAGVVRWKIGAIFGAAAMSGAYAGGRLAHRVPAGVLLVFFGIVMVTTATFMLRPRKDDGAPPRPLKVLQVLALGAGVGIISGLVGAGGGFLIVPALVLFGGLPMREAIGTSLFVIGLQSFAGFAGHAAHVTLDVQLVATLTISAVLGSLLGARFAARVPAPLLRRAFAFLVIAMGLFLFAKQLPLWIAAIAAFGVLAVVFVVSRAGAAPKISGTAR
jgi:uncharacterized membrane protein YfcA